MSRALVNGAKLHYRMFGTGGEVVVFNHGLILDNMSSWYFSIAHHVGEVARVLLYDIRGHGKSERTKGGYTTSELVADLVGLLDHNGIDQPVHLVGNSFGGLICMGMAIEYPERTRSLILVDGHIGDAGYAQLMADTLALEGDEADRRVQEAFAGWVGRHSEMKRNRLAQNSHELVHNTHLVRDMYRNPPVTDEQLAGIAAPTLALYGGRSDVREKGEKLSRLVPDSELTVIEGFSHAILWEATSYVRDRVIAWVLDHAQ